MHAIFSDLALSDLREIWSFLARSSESAADRVVTELIVRSEAVSEGPYAFQIVPEFASSETRRISIRSWAIFYEVKERHIDIVRIVSGARDLSTLRLR